MKFGFITDVHYGNNVDGQMPPQSRREWRRISTHETRLLEFISTCNSENVDFVIQNGDLLDAFGTDFATYLSNAVTDLDTLNCEFYSTLGNHESAICQTDPSVLDATGFWETIDGATQSGTRENIYTIPSPSSYEGGQAYTFDYEKFRFIILCAVVSEDVEAAQISWLEDRLSETEKECIICSHSPLIEPVIYPLTSGLMSPPWANIRNGAEVRTVLENSGKVVAALSGHYHWARFGEIINGIPYYTFHGSVLDRTVYELYDNNVANTPGGLGGTDYTNNAYYIIESSSPVKRSDGQTLSTLKITGYGSNGSPDTTNQRFII